MPVSKKSTPLLPDDAYALTAADKERAAGERALGMVADNSPILLAHAKAVPLDSIKSVQITEVIKRLYQVAQGQRSASKSSKKVRTLVGLAAPQIGESVRIVLVDTDIKPDRKQPGKLTCFINPEIVWRSRETEEGREGCFSTGLVWGLVRRPIAVKVRALALDGKPFEQVLEGFTACIAQHEIDHLDGIRFPDRITSDRKRHWVHAEELPSYPAHIKQWRRLCTRERWERVKQA